MDSLSHGKGASDAGPRVIVVGRSAEFTARLGERLKALGGQLRRASTATVGHHVLAAHPDLVVAVGEACQDGGEALAAALASVETPSPVPLLLVTDQPEAPLGPTVERYGRSARLSAALPAEDLVERALGLLERQASAQQPAHSEAQRTWSQGVDALLAHFEQLAGATPARVTHGLSRPPADPERLRGTSLLLIDADSGRAADIAQALRELEVAVRVWDGDPATLGRLAGKDAEVALIGHDFLQRRGHAAVRALHGHLRLRWTSLALVRWEELFSESTCEPVLPRLAGHVVPLLESSRALAERLTTRGALEADFEPLGPGRTLRALSGCEAPVRVYMAGRHATVELGLNRGRLVGAWGEGARSGPVEGLTAVGLALSLATGRVEAQVRNNPAPPNVMLPVNEALDRAAALAPEALSSAPPPVLHDGPRDAQLPAEEAPPPPAPVSGARRPRPSNGGSIVATIPAPSMQPIPPEALPSRPADDAPAPAARPTVQAPAERLLAALGAGGGEAPSFLDQVTEPVPPPTSLAPSQAIEASTRLTLKQDPLPVVEPPTPDEQPTSRRPAPENDVEAADAAPRRAGTTTMNVRPSELLECVEQLDYDTVSDAAPKPGPPRSPAAEPYSSPPSDLAPALFGRATEPSAPRPPRVPQIEQGGATARQPGAPAEQDTEVAGEPSPPRATGRAGDRRGDLLDELFAPLEDDAPADPQGPTASPAEETAGEGGGPADARAGASEPAPDLAGQLEPSLPPSDPAPAADAPTPPTPPEGRGRQLVGPLVAGLATLVLAGVLGLRGPRLLAQLRGRTREPATAQRPAPPPPPPPTPPPGPSATATAPPPRAPAAPATEAAPAPTSQAEPASPPPAQPPSRPPEGSDAAEQRADALVVEARALQRRGQLERAQALLEEASALDPESARPAASLARLFLESEQPDAAVRWAREAASRRPRRAQLHLLLGDALMQAGKERDARAAWTRASELRPDDPRILARLARGPEDKRKRRRRKRRR